MTADLLRRAAVRAQELADGATPGPWVLDEDDTAIRARRGAGPSVATTIPLGYETRRVNAALVAACDPPFLRAVGEWLAETAIRWDWVEERDLAAAVARALLGESA